MSDDEYANEILTWSTTAAVVAIIVILTLVTVICILKKSPERELEVTTTGAAGPTTLRGRAVAYYNKYWKVTDTDAPVFDSTRRDIRTYNFGTLRTETELEDEEEKALGFYSRGDKSTVLTASK